MIKPRRILYIKITPEEKQIIYSGIEFFEFVKYLSSSISNLLLIKGNYYGTRYMHNFELLEGKELIDKLAEVNIAAFGDFCFVDYAMPHMIAKLNDQQIAEILFMAHMRKPIKSPFFEELKNRFAYLAHDDGWYCKLYCQNVCEFTHVLYGKIVDSLNIPVMCYSKDMEKHLLQLASTAGQSHKK